MKKKMTKRILALVLAAILCISQEIPATASAAVKAEEGKTSVSQERGANPALSNPQHYCLQGKRKEDVTAWSYVYFGSYPQTEVKGAALTNAIKNASYDENGDAWVNGTRYRRLSKKDTDYSLNFGDKAYRYFKWEKIRWRVLVYDASWIVLMADLALDGQYFNDTGNGSTWEKCSLRKWLNQTFYQTAFTSQEQNAIVKTEMWTVENPETGADGGGKTIDNIYLLSLGNTSYRDYGFCEGRGESSSRQMKASDYAYVMGTNRDSAGYCEWYLRSPGYDADFAATITKEGKQDMGGMFVDMEGCGCVPALGIRRSSSLWKKAPSPLKAPSGLKVKATAGDAVKLTWKKVKGASSYQIYRGEPKDEWVYAIKTVKGNSYVDKKLKGGKTYCYYVVARSGTKISFASNTVSKKVLGKLAAPKMTLKADSAARKFTISWKTVKNASKMEILRATGDGAFKKWKVVPANRKSVSYSYGELKKGTQYRFALRAYYKTDGKTIYSNASNMVSFKLTK